MNNKSEKISFGLALILITIILFVIVGNVYASHYHVWTKMSQSTVTDNWGNQVQQCVWKCDDFYNNISHTTITQGLSFCPMP